MNFRIYLNTVSTEDTRPVVTICFASEQFSLVLVHPGILKEPIRSNRGFAGLNPKLKNGVVAVFSFGRTVSLFFNNF